MACCCASPILLLNLPPPRGARECSFTTRKQDQGDEVRKGAGRFPSPTSPHWLHFLVINRHPVALHWHLGALGRALPH